MTSLSLLNESSLKRKLFDSRRISHWVTAFVCLVVVPLTAGCTTLGLPYRVDVVNFGSEGVVLVDFPADGGFRNRVLPQLIEPAYFRTFSGHVHSLPDHVEVKWKLAELTNCDALLFRSIAGKPKYIRDIPNYLKQLPDPVYYSVHTCDWAAPGNQLFTQQLDIAAIRNSEAYKKAGTSSGDVLHPYYLLITLVFRGDQLHVVTSTSEGGGMHTSDDPNYW